MEACLKQKQEEAKVNRAPFMKKKSLLMHQLIIVNTADFHFRFLNTIITWNKPWLGNIGISRLMF